jgi:hypothetical protein
MRNFLAHLVMPMTIKENPNTVDITIDSFSFWKKAK